MSKSTCSITSILALSVTIFVNVSCSDNDGSNAQLPTFEGLERILPQFDTSKLVLPPEPAVAAIEIEKAKVKTVIRDAEKNAQKIAMVEKENARLQVELKKIDKDIQKLTSTTYGQQGLLGPYAEIIAKNGKVTDADVRATETFVDGFLSAFSDKTTPLQKQIRELDGEIKSLSDEKAGLSYFALYISGEGREVQEKIDLLEGAKIKVSEFIQHYVALQDAAVREKVEAINAAIPQTQKNIQSFNTQLNVLKTQKQSLVNKIAQNESVLSSLKNNNFKFTRASTEQGKTYSSLELQLIRSKIDIVQKIASAQKLSILDIVDATILAHLGASKNSSLAFSEFKKNLSAISEKTNSEDASKFKITYENEIAERFHKGEELVYNINAVTVVDPIVNNRMQCYSGTNLFLILDELRMLPQKHKVVIFKSGHVLPGFITIKNNQMNLIGIETTASGKAQVDYGPTAQISGGIRVFDAHQFLLSELFKDEITNFSEIYKQMLDTSALYGFQVEKFESLSAQPQKQDANTRAALNSSPLGFGIARVQEGDIERQNFDELIDTSFLPQKEGPLIVSERSPVEENELLEEPVSGLWSYNDFKDSEYYFLQEIYAAPASTVSCALGRLKPKPEYMFTIELANNYKETGGIYAYGSLHTEYTESLDSFLEGRSSQLETNKLQVLDLSINKKKYNDCHFRVHGQRSAQMDEKRVFMEIQCASRDADKDKDFKLSVNCKLDERQFFVEAYTTPTKPPAIEQ